MQQTLRNTYFLCFSDFSVFVMFNFQLHKGLLQNMLNYRLGTVNEKHWGFKPVFAAANLTLSQLVLEKKMKKMSIYSF